MRPVPPSPLSSTLMTLLLAGSLALAGCAGEAERKAPSQQQGVSDVIAEQTQQTDTTDASQGNATEERQAFVGDASSAYDEVDVDLTTMNAEMVYATVYDMVSNPSDYVGKTVRMSGPYYHTHYEQTGMDYHFVIIQDATACCAQGLEFVWGDGTHVYPDDYPAEGTEVIVAGLFETYTEGTNLYIHLTGASVEAA